MLGYDFMGEGKETGMVKLLESTNMSKLTTLKIAFNNCPEKISERVFTAIEKKLHMLEKLCLLQANAKAIEKGKKTFKKNCEVVSEEWFDWVAFPLKAAGMLYFVYYYQNSAKTYKTCQEYPKKNRKNVINTDPKYWASDTSPHLVNPSSPAWNPPSPHTRSTPLGSTSPPVSPWTRTIAPPLSSNCTCCLPGHQNWKTFFTDQILCCCCNLPLTSSCYEIMTHRSPACNLSCSLNYGSSLSLYCPCFMVMKIT